MTTISISFARSISIEVVFLPQQQDGGLKHIADSLEGLAQLPTPVDADVLSNVVKLCRGIPGHVSRAATSTEDLTLQLKRSFALLLKISELSCDGTGTVTPDLSEFRTATYQSLVYISEANGGVAHLADIIKDGAAAGPRAFEASVRLVANVATNLSTAAHSMLVVRLMSAYIEGPRQLITQLFGMLIHLSGCSTSAATFLARGPMAWLFHRLRQAVESHSVEVPKLLTDTNVLVQIWSRARYFNNPEWVIGCVDTAMGALRMKAVQEDPDALLHALYITANLVLSLKSANSPLLVSSSICKLVPLLTTTARRSHDHSVVACCTNILHFLAEVCVFASCDSGDAPVRALGAALIDAGQVRVFRALEVAFREEREEAVEVSEAVGRAAVAASLGARDGAAGPKSNRMVISENVKFQGQGERQAFTLSMFEEFNREIFKYALPPCTLIGYSDALPVGTAGLMAPTQYLNNFATRLHPQGFVERFDGLLHGGTILLSNTILDTPLKVATTLLHEACHLAEWVVDGTADPPHGFFFKKWGHLATKEYPSRAVTVYHSYKENYRYHYTCEACSYVHGQRNADRVQPCLRCSHNVFLPVDLGFPGRPVGEQRPQTRN
jgi:SprT-like family